MGEGDGELQMTPYAATGRSGKINVRYFRTVMTHAVDVDGLVWKFFPSASSAEAYATERSAEGYDAVIVQATPHQLTEPADPKDVATVDGWQATDPPADDAVFADKLNDLFESNAYSTEDFADALREEGVIMATEIATRLLARKGGLPSDSVIEAIARVFDVEPEYFLGPPAPAVPGEPPSAHSDLRLNRYPPEGRHADRSVTRPTQTSSELTITLQELGRMVEALSVTADRYLVDPQADTALATALTRVIAALGRDLGQAQGDEVLVRRALLEEIVLAWARTGPSDSSSRVEFLWAAEVLGKAPSP
jgi:transcriptional regulator with XRE-family HTH domain